MLWRPQSFGSRGASPPGLKEWGRKLCFFLKNRKGAQNQSTHSLFPPRASGPTSLLVTRQRRGGRPQSMARAAQAKDRERHSFTHVHTAIEATRVLLLH